MDSSSMPTEESSGCSLAPQYEEGDCCAVHLGEIELKDGRVFKGVILEFPAGPPKLPIAVVWDGTPLTLSIKEK
jgi:hypothetical protein